MQSTYIRRAAVIIGALFWISNLVTLVGTVISGGVPTAARALTTMYPHSGQVIAGTLIAHINDAAIIGYALVLFPILVRHSGRLAMTYVAFKVVEALLLLAGAAMLLSLINLSQSYLAAGGADSVTFKASADLVLAQQFWAGRLAALAYLIATPVLNIVLYRHRLVPRPISVFGLVALAMLAAGLATGVGDPTRGFEAGQLLVIPIIVWELTFATWLMVRGFAPSAVADGNTRLLSPLEPSPRWATSLPEQPS